MNVFPVLWRKRHKLFCGSSLKSVHEGEAIDHPIGPPRTQKRLTIAQSMRKAEFVA
jgi:hypothetical protein